MRRALLSLLACVAACKTPVERSGVTGVRLTVSFDAALAVDQIVVVGHRQNGELLGVETLPDRPAGALSGAESLAILLSAPVEGELIRLRIDGLAAGAVVTSGRGTVQVALGTMQAVTVDLGAPAVCGDSVVQATLEACDDGDAADGDGCDDECAIESGAACLPGSPSVCSVGCGDGVTAGAEACDDGDNDDGDGCSKQCVVEAGYVCSGLRSTCTALCGNGKLNGTEACDDGDRDDGDGCDSDCAKEPGYACDGEPSVCAFTCGDGDLDTGEQCDDHDLDVGDGCDASCQKEAGWECDTAMPSVCHFSCGDSTIDSGEQCDDGNLTPTDGCDDTCQREVGWECSGAGASSCHFSCGDSTLDVGEQCDDGDGGGDGCDGSCAIELGWECDTAAMPSVCNLKCGNGCLDPGETCDPGVFSGACGVRPQPLAGETCASRGVRQGGGAGVACANDCSAFLLAGCTGGAIDSVAQIRAAIADAYSVNGHEVITIQPGVYAVSGTPIAMDECSGVACGAPKPYGITLRGASGATGVTFMADGSSPPAGGTLIQVYSGKNVFSGLTWLNPATGLVLDGSNNADGDNVVTNCRFVRTDATAGRKFINITSNGNVIRSTSFENTSTAVDYAIQTNAADTVIAMNLFNGSFGGTSPKAAISVLTASAQKITIDHNTMLILGFGIHTNSDPTLVARDNVLVSADGLSTAWRIGNGGIIVPTGPTGSQKNLVFNHGTDCSGSACAGLCMGVLCDILSTSPQLDSALCLANPGVPPNPAINAGIDLGYDFLDDDARPFSGMFPDLGAREAGSTRRYGNVSSVCP